ncbi:MAG: hypothetical protein AAFX87_09610 [Bacteroidota bacterium]
MIKTFTHDDLIRYLYGDTSKKENKEIEKALICDSELQEIYKELSAVKNQLERSLKEPSAKALTNIIHFSRSYEPEVKH